MKKAFFLAVLLIAGRAQANDIDLSIDNFSRNNSIVSAVLKVTNNLTTPVSSIFIDCAFLDGQKKAIDIGKANIDHIESKGYAYAKASIVTDQQIQFADCRVAHSRK